MLEEKKQVEKQEEVENSDKESSGVVGMASIQQRTSNEKRRPGCGRDGFYTTMD